LSLRSRIFLLALLVAAPAALAGGAADPGVTKDRILIGSSGPLTGDAAGAGAVLRGADAYFKYVNARGGVDGRRLVFRYLDDAGDLAQAEENIRALVEDERVFALFSVVGTDANLAVRAYTSGLRVPLVFSATGATALGRDPYAIGYAPPYAAEGAVYARHVLASNGKRAEVAVLYQADDYGKDLLAGLRKGLGASGKLIAKAVGYDPLTTDVRPQVAELRATGANTLMLFTSGPFAIEAVAHATRLAWKPQLYVADAASAPALMRRMPQASAQRAVSISFVKDPAAWAGDPGAALAGRIVTRYAPGAPRDRFVVAGMAAAYSLVDALKKVGKTPTRASLMRAVTHMNEASNPFLLPGMRVRTTPTSRFPISQVALQRWRNGRWARFGGLQPASP